MTPTEHCRVELNIPNDTRAVGAVHGALQHTARHLGLPSDEEERLIAVAERLLRSALDSLPEDRGLVVLIQEHPDRIEIDMSCEGDGPADWNSARQLPGIEQVKRVARGGRTHLLLVKLLPGAAEAPPSAN